MSKTPYAYRKQAEEERLAKVASCMDSLRKHKAQQSLPLLDRIDKVLCKEDQYRSIKGTDSQFQAFKSIVNVIDGTRLLDLTLGSFEQYKRLLKFISIAKLNKHWIRKPEDWTPKSSNADKQFSSLLRHLFAQYSIPTFMDSAWDQPLNPYVTNHHIQWFINVAQGQNIRKQEGLPIKMTKTMAHMMMMAPSDFSINAAIRYGQIKALGGSDRTVKAVLGTGLDTFNKDEDFWETVIRFFIANPMLDTAHYGPIVDYIEFQRGPRGEQPGMTMTGRSVETLLERVEKWHKQLERDTKRPMLSWEPSGINGFEYIEGQDNNRTEWKISELLSSKKLKEEGRIMKHCIGSYDASCAKHETAVFSMTRSTNLEYARCLTIAVVVNNRRIREARGFCNQFAAQKHARILGLWASKENLTIDFDR